MITALEVENFKGIAARQRIEFAPLTLLFGANSAGKSTLLQALLYLHELLERGSADVDRTELGGSVLELGGFARLVHRHEMDRAIVLRAEFATPGGLDHFGRDLPDFPFPDLEDEVESAWIEIKIRHRTTSTYHGPVIETAKIGVNGITQPLVVLSVDATMRKGEPVEATIDLGHPIIAAVADQIQESWCSAAGVRASKIVEGPADHVSEFLKDYPEYHRHMPVFALAARRPGALPSYLEPLVLIADAEWDHDGVLAHVRMFLEMIVVGTTARLAGFLSNAQYVGPLRAIPPRGFLYERVGRITSWADGLAAWDLLLADRLTLVERTNVWLKRLGAGCQVVVQQLIAEDADEEEGAEGHVDKSVRRLLLDTGAGSFVLPSEVGAGVSQIIPVVVAALDGRSGLALVEQPEIHVHPAVQVGLGDLLIDAVTREGSRRTLLVETHSEHLILRLLRRIRETTEKDLVEGAPAFAEDKLSVLYVESGPDGVRIRRLRVDERGEFKDRWPKGFFAERMEELL